MVRGVNVLGVRGEVGWLVAGGGVPGGGTGGGWAVALCSVRARKEGKKDLGWEGQDAAQQQKMPVVVESLVLTRWCVDACVVEFKCRRRTFLLVKGVAVPKEEWGQPWTGQK